MNLFFKKINRDFLLVFGLFFLITPLEAEQKSFPAKEISSILIKVPQLNLKLSHKKSNQLSFQWTGSLSFQKDEKELVIQSRDFNSSSSWRTKTKEKTQTLEISGPSRSLKLFSFRLESSFSGWKSPVFISSFIGNIKANKNKGPWEISLKEGQVYVHQHQGSLSVKGFQVKHLLTSSQGDFQFYLNEGEVKLRKSEGNLKFTTDKAYVQLRNFKGSLKGFSQSGDIHASVKPETMDLQSEKGVIRAYFMGQGPRVKAYTEAGKIYSPRYFHKKFSGKSTKVSGRIKSSLKEGEVYLKSKTGTIYIN